MTNFMKTALVIFLIVAVGSFAYAYPIKDSADFDWKYEWTTAGMLPDAYDLDDREGGDFWAVGAAATYTTAPGEYLLFSMTVRTQNTHWQSDGHSGHPGNVWPGHFHQEEGYTIEAAFQVLTTNGIEPYTVTLGASVPENGGPNSGLAIGPHGQLWCDGTNTNAIVLGGEVDNTDTYHAFRIVAHPGLPIKFSVYRDNELLADNLDPPNNLYTETDRAYFGDTSSRYGGEAKMDYLRFTAGPWAPVPEPATLTMLVMLFVAGLVFRRR